MRSASRRGIDQCARAPATSTYVTAVARAGSDPAPAVAARPRRAGARDAPRVRARIPTLEAPALRCVYPLPTRTYVDDQNTPKFRTSTPLGLSDHDDLWMRNCIDAENSFRTLRAAEWTQVEFGDFN
ncbi:hypothetical protein EVAR_93958_1 [Eumeta japonica]|uniref:Uncharacterized protein n=1 Tax=Eumeta variegata TaxID=151549 RepID=A0A4C1TP82_EUMVA|nr:hypothetical protein EVAR_93958_1 [Eumeta japonica]